MVEFNFSLTYLELYLIVINILSFILYSLDKLQAIRVDKNITRVSELNLLLIAFIGGSLASLISMVLFRHKIKKLSFMLKFVIVLVIQLFSIYYFRAYL